MTEIDRFDPFAGRVSAALEEIAPATRPAYLDDVLATTAGTRQRPRWTFITRWLPMDTAITQPVRLARSPMRMFLVLALLVILALAAAIAWVGTQTRVPPPFGPADNGILVYSHSGDLWTRGTLTTGEHLLYAADGEQTNPSFSPDGRWLAFVTSLGDGDHFSVMRADGTAARDIAVIPPTGNAQAAWRPDSRAVGLIYNVNLIPHLFIVSLDGTPTVDIAIPGVWPLDLAWRPPDGHELVVRAQTPDGDTDLYLLNADGTNIRPLHLPIQSSDFGNVYTNSGANWSPDGSTIAYNAVVPDPSGTGQVFRVHLVNPDGSNDRELPGPPPDPQGRPVHENWPQYSPDGRWILVHRWHLNNVPDPQGWLAVMPADGSAPARDIGPKIPGGNDTGLIKLWSPDGSTILMRTQNTTTAYSIDPFTGQTATLDWTSELPDWQRVIH